MTANLPCAGCGYPTPDRPDGWDVEGYNYCSDCASEVVDMTTRQRIIGAYCRAFGDEYPGGRDEDQWADIAELMADLAAFETMEQCLDTLRAMGYDLNGAEERVNAVRRELGVRELPRGYEWLVARIRWLRNLYKRHASDRHLTDAEYAAIVLSELLRECGEED